MTSKTHQDKVYRVTISRLVPRKDYSVKSQYCAITMLVQSKIDNDLELFDLINKDLSNNHLIVSSPSIALDTVDGTVTTIHKDEMCLQHYQGAHQHHRKYKILPETVSITLYDGPYRSMIDERVHVSVDKWSYDVAGRKVSINLTLNGKKMTIDGRMRPDCLTDDMEYRASVIDPCMPHRPRNNYTVVLQTHGDDAYYQVSFNKELLDVKSLTKGVSVYGVNS